MKRYFLTVLILLIPGIAIGAYPLDGPLAYTKFTEQDTPGRIDISSAANPQKVSVTLMDTDDESYAYIDAGASAINANFTYEFEFYVSASAAGSLVALATVSDTLDDLKGIVDASGNSLSFYSYNNSGTYEIKLYEVDGGTGYATANGTCTISLSTLYYARFWKDESVGSYGTLYGRVYSDRSRTTTVGSLMSLTLHSSLKDYRYLISPQSYNTGTNGRETSLYIQFFTTDPDATNIPGVTNETQCFPGPTQEAAFEDEGYHVVHWLPKDTEYMHVAFADSDDDIFDEPISSVGVFPYTCVGGHEFDICDGFTQTWGGFIGAVTNTNTATTGWEVSEYHKWTESLLYNTIDCKNDAGFSGTGAANAQGPSIMNCDHDYIWWAWNYTTINGGPDDDVHQIIVKRSDNAWSVDTYFTGVVMDTQTTDTETMGIPQLVNFYHPSDTYPTIGVGWTYDDDFFFRFCDGPEGMGAHTGANNSATLTDASKSGVWSENEHQGKLIQNLTDGSVDTAIDYNSSTGTATVTLVGGTDGDFDTNDEYTIWNATETICTNDVVDTSAFRIVITQNNEAHAFWQPDAATISHSWRPGTIDGTWTQLDDVVSDVGALNAWTATADLGNTESIYIHYHDGTNIDQTIWNGSSWSSPSAVVSSVNLLGNNQLTAPKRAVWSFPVAYADSDEHRVKTHIVTLSPTNQSDRSGTFVSNKGQPVQGTKPLGPEYMATSGERSFVLVTGANHHSLGRFYDNAGGYWEGSGFVEIGEYYPDLHNSHATIIDDDGYLYVIIGGRYLSSGGETEKNDMILYRSNVTFPNIPANFSMTTDFDNVSPSFLGGTDTGRGYKYIFAIDDGASHEHLHLIFVDGDGVPTASSAGEEITISSFWPERDSGAGACPGADDCGEWSTETILVDGKDDGDDADPHLYIGGVCVGYESPPKIHMTWSFREADNVPAIPGGSILQDELNYMCITQPAWGNAYTATDAAGNGLGLPQEVDSADRDSIIDNDDVGTTSFVQVNSSIQVVDAATDYPIVCYITRYEDPPYTIDALMISYWDTDGGPAWANVTVEDDDTVFPFISSPRMIIGSSGKIFIYLEEKINGVVELVKYTSTDSDDWATWVGPTQITENSTFDVAYPLLSEFSESPEVINVIRHERVSREHSEVWFNSASLSPGQGFTQGIMRGICRGIGK